jgi:hypothetical protein
LCHVVEILVVVRLTIGGSARDDFKVEGDAVAAGHPGGWFHDIFKLFWPPAHVIYSNEAIELIVNSAC